MADTINTDKFSDVLRRKSIQLPERRVLIARIQGTEQAGDLKLVPAIGRNVLTEFGVTPAPETAEPASKHR